ncbi:MAG: S-layer homology domain-containing protein [Oscillospiraceae bacterium]|nr:S-layer homology domain-containing protein [Oscillospiraceae bacterium]
MKKQRILSALLAMCLVFSLVPTALAAGADDFTDVGRDSWCYEYVDYVTSEGYFLGTTDTAFSPNRNMTRAMFVVVLARFDGVKVDNSQSAFTDVEPGSWCAGAVNWAAANKIVEGKGDGRFAPNDPITRAQMCAIMDRYVDYYTAKHDVTVAENGKAANLADQSQVPSYATAGVRNCQIYGLIYGYEDGTFRPQAYSTRAHVAAIIYRLAFLIDGAEPVKKPGGGRPSGSGGGGGGSTKTYTYTLTYDANGGVFPAGTKTTVDVTGTSGTFTVTIPSMAQPVKAGYTFKGWSTNPNGPAQTRISVSGNTTLYAVWDAEPVPAGSYTITYVLNYEGAPELAPAYTESSTEESKAFTTLDAQTREGYVFAGWNTAANGCGSTYAENCAYTATGDMILYAQWISDKDYIGIAVKNAMAQANEDYINDARLIYGDNAVVIEPLTFSGSDADDETVVRGQTLKARVSVTDDAVADIITLASSVACGLVDVSRDDLPTEGDVKDLVKEIVDAIEEATGLVINRDTTLAEIQEQVYQIVLTQGKSLWANFYNESGNYYTGDIKVTAGSYTATIKVDQANKTTTLDGSKREAVKRIAGAVARELYASLKEASGGAYINEALISSTVNVEFADPDNDYGEATVSYPHEYPVTVQLRLQGNELVDYKFDGKSFVKLNVTESIQTAYEDGIASIVKAALESERMANMLRPIIVETLEKDETFNGLKNQLADKGITLSATNEQVIEALTVTEDENGETVVDKWIAANLEPLYNYLWVESGNVSIDGAELAGVCDNSVLVETIWNAVKNDIPDDEAEIDEFVQEQIKDQLEKAEITDAWIVGAVNSNNDVQSAKKLLETDGATIEPADLNLDIKTVDDINALMAVGDVKATTYVFGIPTTVTMTNFGAGVRNYIRETADEELSNKLADSETLKDIVNSNEDVKDYLIYSALVEMGLAFEDEKAAVKDAALEALLDPETGMIGSTARDYINEKIGTKVQNAIGDELNGEGNLATLLKARNLKTYEGLAAAKFGNVVTLLRSDFVDEIVGGKGDSYVDRYLGKVIGKIPAGAAVTVNGVEIDKDALDALAAASTTSEAIDAVADILDQFSDLSINSFAEPGIPVKVTYNARNFEFNLVIEAQ